MHFILISKKHFLYTEYNLATPKTSNKKRNCIPVLSEFELSNATIIDTNCMRVACKVNCNFPLELDTIFGKLSIA